MAELGFTQLEPRPIGRNRDEFDAHPMEEGLIRTLDIVLSGSILFLLLPLLIFLLLLIILVDRHPPLYRHRRIGLRGIPFDCLKLRSMAPAADREIERLLNSNPVIRAEFLRTHKLRNDPRVTPLGRFLRRSALDELPQFINVLRGDMSIVGPRPIVHEEIWHYRHRFDAYRTLRPGLTGLWQVSRRNNADYARRVAADLIYRRRRSLVLNVRIIVATIPAILTGRGAY